MWPFGDTVFDACVCVCVGVRVRKDNLTSCNSGVNMDDVDCAGSSLSQNHNSITSQSLSTYQARPRTSQAARHHATGSADLCTMLIRGRVTVWQTSRI